MVRPGRPGRAATHPRAFQLLLLPPLGRCGGVFRSDRPRIRLRAAVRSGVSDDLDGSERAARGGGAGAGVRRAPAARHRLRRRRVARMRCWSSTCARRWRRSRRGSGGRCWRGTSAFTVTRWREDASQGLPIAPVRVGGGGDAGGGGRRRDARSIPRPGRCCATASGRGWSGASGATCRGSRGRGMRRSASRAGFGASLGRGAGGPAAGGVPAGGAFLREPRRRAAASPGRCRSACWC